MAEKAKTEKAYIKKHKELTAKLSGIGFIWPEISTLPAESHTVPAEKTPKLGYDLYAYWISKEDKKTVSRLVSTEEADFLEEWIENSRKLFA